MSRMFFSVTGWPSRSLFRLKSPLSDGPTFFHRILRYGIRSIAEILLFLFLPGRCVNILARPRLGEAVRQRRGAPPEAYSLKKAA